MGVVTSVKQRAIVVFDYTRMGVGQSYDDAVYLSQKDAVAMPWSEANTILLRGNGYDVPAPITQLYHWPGQHPPFPHQVDMAGFITTRPKSFLFGGIGTGKTLTMLWAFDWLASAYRVAHKPLSRMLVLAPKSTMISLWGREMATSFMHRKHIMPMGNDRHLPIQDFGDGVIILNHDAIRNEDVMKAVSKWKPEIIAVDESTAYKGWRTDRTRALRKIVKNVDPAYIWYASGSPMPQSPMDMYGQAMMICPTAIPNTKDAFQRSTMRQVTEYKWVPRRGAIDMIYEWIAPYSIRYSIEDTTVVLPTFRSGTMKVEETAQQTDLAKQLSDDAVALVDSGEMITAVNEGVFMSKLLQIAGGAAYGVGGEDEQTIVEVDVQPKLDALMKIIDVSKGPVIVFASYTAHVDRLKVHCKRQGLRVGIVDGRVTSAKKRAKIFQQVQDGELDVLVANPAAMAHGITLTTSNIIVWWSLPFKAETYEQANGRIRRIGQERLQNYVHLTCTDAENMVLSRLLAGLRLQGVLLKLIRGGAK